MPLGNEDCYLFRLNPKFKIFSPVYGEGKNQYIYMNNEQYYKNQTEKGIGFGGKGKNARIWLDSNLFHDSHCSESDHTYEKGSLSDSGLEFMKLEKVEVWSFPDVQIPEALRLKRRQSINVQM